MACHRLFALRALRFLRALERCLQQLGPAGQAGGPSRGLPQLQTGQGSVSVPVCLCLCLCLCLCVCLCVCGPQVDARQDGLVRRFASCLLCGTGSAQRQELDLKIGCIFTRLMTRQYLRYAVEKSLDPKPRGRGQKAVRTMRILRGSAWRDQTCLSYGPCQTPTLWFCWALKEGRARFRHKIAC